MMMTSSSSSSSAVVRVDKATSEFLIGPDWTLNIDICDSINSNPGLAKDVVKTVKKRLQHKNPKVQLLALTLLETMVKNCGDYVHFQIAEKSLLQEMVKIVKKKADMHVRDKILNLLDSWQEAFGGPGGKHSQYYWAYDELRRGGVGFPPRSSDAALIFTPPASRLPPSGMPSNSSTRLDEAMAAEMENLSVSSLNSMRNALDLLTDMLQAVNPSESMAVKDEIIVDLVDRCHANQRKLMQMLSTEGDEELLGQGLELNDNLQSVLAKHDAIASGSLLINEEGNVKPQTSETSSSNLRPKEVRESSPTSNAIPSAAPMALTRNTTEEEEEEEDDFALLARRHTKVQSAASQSTSNEISGGATAVNVNRSSVPAAEPVPSNALALPDPPAPLKTSTEQDMIDFLSITLSTTATSPHSPPVSSTSEQSMHQEYVSPTTQGHSNDGSQGPASLNSYVVPWAQSQPQPQPNSQQQDHPPLQPQHQTPPQYPQYSSHYPPPPWAATPGYLNSHNPPCLRPNSYSNPPGNSYTPYIPMQETRPMQYASPLPARTNNGSAISGNGSNPTTTATVGPRPFVPSYRLFEDLNVLGSADGRHRVESSASSPSLPGSNSSQGMVGGGK